MSVNFVPVVFFFFYEKEISTLFHSRLSIFPINISILTTLENRLGKLIRNRMITVRAKIRIHCLSPARYLITRIKRLLMQCRLNLAPPKGIQPQCAWHSNLCIELVTVQFHHYYVPVFFPYPFLSSRLAAFCNDFNVTVFDMTILLFEDNGIYIQSELMDGILPFLLNELLSAMLYF